MDIVITNWGLQTYLALRHRNVFTLDDYNDKLRPDALLLRDYPNSPRFQNAKFWGSADNNDASCFKMKWHNIGPGRVQLRVGVVLHGGDALICEGYVKSSPNADKRYTRRLRVHAELIRRGQYQKLGELT